MPPPITVFMLNRHIEDLFTEKSYQAIDYHWVASENISPYAAMAVVAAEDQQFFQHHGFDLKSIRYWAMQDNLNFPEHSHTSKRLDQIVCRSFGRLQFEY